MTVGKLSFVICVLFLFMYRSCFCRYVLQNSSLKISSPQNLKGIYECVVSDHGVPQHGGTLTGVVVYPKVNQEACNSFGHEFSFKSKVHAGSLPVFLLVDGRDCHFTLKAKNAQNAGAAGILIANYDFFITMYSLQEEDVYNMENLTIPSAIIARSLGASLKKALSEGEFVRVNLEWTEDSTRGDEEVDMNKNVDECEPNYDDKIEEHEWDVHMPSDNFMWRFMIKSTPILGFLMPNMKRWMIVLWENGIIESLLNTYKL